MRKLWAITCFFNPAGYKRRVRNYRWFREHLNVPLITVELSFGNQFTLGPGDAEILVQLDQGDILFQKERLLNLALERLPEDCTAVAWIDCDVVFASRDWPEQTLEALERFAVVQPFSERVNLPPDTGPEPIAGWNGPCDRPSLMALVHNSGLKTAEDFEFKHVTPLAACGLAWAARRDLLEKHGLYDGGILTGGDVLIFGAGLGILESRYIQWRLNAESRRHYREWADPFAQAVDRNMGYVAGRLLHLWHGAEAPRRYGRCLLELQDLGFDPYLDIAKTEQGTWRWSSEKPRLHAHVRDYFWSRDEDAGQ